MSKQKILIIFEIEDNEIVRDKFNDIIQHQIGMSNIAYSEELIDDTYLRANNKEYQKILKDYKQIKDKKKDYLINNK